MKGIFQPFFVGDPKWESVFRIPNAAFKVWMIHYSMEQQKRRTSWPSAISLRELTGMNRKTIFEARRWLIENGWLVKLGRKPSKRGLPVPVFRVERGTLVPKNGRYKVPKIEHYKDPKNGRYKVPKIGTRIIAIESEQIESKQVSFSQSVSQGDVLTSEEKTLQGFDSTQRSQVITLRDQLGNSDIALAFGLPYFTTAHAGSLLRIAKAMYERNRSLDWLSYLVGHTMAAKDRESKFWKSRLQTGDKGIAKLAQFLEKGTIAEQFDALLVAQRGTDVFDATRENHWLFRTFKGASA
jgi:hypothetical protein